MHGFEHMFGGGLGARCPAGGRGGADGMETRGPQPTQSVAQAHVANSEPGPPPSSLHSLPPTLRQLLMQTMAEECGGGGGDAVRTPQSAPYAHTGHSEPELPSSQSESEAKKHVAMQMPGGGLVAGGDMGGLDVGGGLMGRTPPPPAQSVPYW